MKRERQSLDGIWQFQFQRGVPDQPDKTSEWRTIDVPAPWQAQFDNLREAAGTGWYRRQVDIPTNWQHQSVILHIGAAYHFTSLWVNGQHIANHADGYLPLECDITAALRPGTTNTLLIRVVSPSDNETLYPDMTVLAAATRQTKLVRAAWRHLAVRLAGMPSPHSPVPPTPTAGFSQRERSPAQ